MIETEFIHYNDLVVEDNSVNEEAGQVSQATATIQYEHSFEKLTG